MPTPPAKAASALEDFLDLFEAVGAAGIDYVVIGGCAVAAYARLIGETVFSNDLDLLVTRRSLEGVIADGGIGGASLLKVPSPRSVPVAVLDWRGREINLLTSTTQMPPADVEARAARDFRIGPAGFAVPIADPFDLLRNKLAVNRPKDAPHIPILRRFLDEEVVAAFTHEVEPRARIAPAERLLEVLSAQTLAPALAERLVPLARLPADFRFLAHRCPTTELLTVLAAHASDDTRATVMRIRSSRGL